MPLSRHDGAAPRVGYVAVRHITGRNAELERAIGDHLASLDRLHGELDIPTLPMDALEVWRQRYSRGVALLLHPLWLGVAQSCVRVNVQS